MAPMGVEVEIVASIDGWVGVGHHHEPSFVERGG